MAQGYEDRETGKDPLMIVAIVVFAAIVLVGVVFILPVLMFRSMWLSVKEGFMEYIRPGRACKSSSGFEGR